MVFELQRSVISIRVCGFLCGLRAGDFLDDLFHQLTKMRVVHTVIEL